MTNDTNRYTAVQHSSGTGDIQFMAVKHTVVKDPKDKGNKEAKRIYTIRLLMDSNTEGGLTLKNLLLEVNPAKIKTLKNAELINEGKGNLYYVSFESDANHQPRVIGIDGTQLTGEDVPRFTKGSTGKASVDFAVITYSDGTQIVRMNQVNLSELNIAPETVNLDPAAIAAKAKKVGLTA